MNKSNIDPRDVELKGRLFNILKLRERLLVADAILRPIAQFWILAAVLICGPYALDPIVYPIYQGFIYSVLIFAVYYGLIGTVRRSAEIYLEKLSALYGYDLTKGTLGELQKKLDTEKPFKDSDDPAVVRFLFTIAKFCLIPRRGLIQQSVVISQLVFLGYYLYNYQHYFGTQTLLYFPDILWQMHGAVTFFGIIMMMKNASFLITNRFFLALANIVLDPRGTGRRAADRIADAQSAHLAIEKAMEEYRFRDDVPPPSSECSHCIKEMSVHVVKEVPLLLVPTPVETGNITTKEVGDTPSPDKK